MSKFFHFFLPNGHACGCDLYSLIIQHKPLVYPTLGNTLVEQIVSDNGKLGLKLKDFLIKAFHNHRMNLPHGEFNHTGLCWMKSNPNPSFQEVLSFTTECGLSIGNIVIPDFEKEEKILISKFTPLWCSKEIANAKIKKFFPFEKKNEKYEIVAEGVHTTEEFANKIEGLIV